MIKGLLSIIIPSRDPRFLQKTIDDLLVKAEGEIEIIVVFDGIWPNPMIKTHPKVRVIHHGTIHNSPGMRASINRGVAISKGEYIMKIDEHCMMDEKYDTKLKADCEDDWMVIPRRKRLEPETWTLVEDGRKPIDYMRIDYPYQRPEDKTCGLHGAEDKDRYHANKELLIDDNMTMQGSCYFLPRKLWDSVIVRLEDEKYGPFTAEAQELSMKVWLSGGRVIVNKKTWYAHWHKGRAGKGYGFCNNQYKQHAEQMEKGRLFCIDFWLNNRWEKRKHDFKWLIEKFWPIKGWPENWEKQVLIDKEKDFSTTKYKNDYWLQNLRDKL